MSPENNAPPRRKAVIWLSEDAQNDHDDYALMLKTLVDVLRADAPNWPKYGGIENNCEFVRQAARMRDTFADIFSRSKEGRNP